MSMVSFICTGLHSISLLLFSDISTAGSLNIPQTGHQGRAPKDKSVRPPSSKSSASSLPGVVSSNAAVTGVHSSSSAKTSTSSTYISTFPKDIQKPPMNTTPPMSSTIAQPPIGAGVKDSFQSATSQFDPLEALLTSPTKLHVPVEGNSSPTEILGKDQKLFQPFSSGDVHQIPVSLSPVFSSENFTSPVKTSASKQQDFDVLTTPQKLFLGSTDNLISLVSSSSSTSSSEVRHFGLSQDVTSLCTDSQAYKVSLQDEKSPLKSQFYTGVIDHMNISPKMGQLPRKKELNSGPGIPAGPLSTLDLSGSPSPDQKSRAGDYLPARIASPKISPALPTGIMDSDLAALPAKSQTFGGVPDVLPSSGITAAVPKPFGSAQTTNAGVIPAVPNPAIDIAVNPLGTGYFNALTSKLIDPTFSLCPDLNKPNSSSVYSGDDGSKGKSYYENGILINQDYDKISDTNDEDDLERLIDDIDTKHDNMDTKGISEIEELLNEFNDKHPEEIKNKTPVDDFLSDVLGEKSKPTADSNKTDDMSHHADPFEMNQSAISELLEKEMEIIDKETKEVEKSRLSAAGGFLASSTSSSTTSTVTTTATSSSTVSTTASTSSVITPTVISSDTKTASESEPKAAPPAPEEPVDFEIPKVGKLMKIRKYVEIQKQKEQTAEKHVEVKVHEKKEPVVEEKPQTILIQVSKRKKIEYGPYINIQSLLEGKPKAMEANSPQKPFRPKPKPQVPTRRTFNLRERKRTDFASLAGTATRSGETKKGDEKAKVDKGGKAEKDETVAKSEEQSDGKTKEEDSPGEPKILTRKQEKAKQEMEKAASAKKKGSASKTADKDANKCDDGIAKDDGKPNLRTRSAKAEAETSESKNLRKRVVKTTPDSVKAKVKKVDGGSDTEEKVTRSKAKQKIDKNEIKKCSVNLGEKYNESKIKIKKPDKEGNKVSRDKESDTIVTEKDVSEKDAEVSDKKIDNKDISVKTQSTKVGNIFESMEEHGKEVFGKDQSVEESKNTEFEVPQKQSDEIKQIDKGCEEKKTVRLQDKITESTVISISTGTDKKVTMKLKLGPEFMKSSHEFVSAPKKRKFDFLIEDPPLSESSEAFKEQKDVASQITEKEMDTSESDKKEKKDSVENEFQRLVNEAMAEVKNAQKEGDSGKQERYVNLRKRLNESIKYNVDDSDDEMVGLAEMSDGAAKSQKQGLPKMGTTKGQGKTVAKGIPKSGVESVTSQPEACKQQKKDVDVYDFTDTEMSDHEESGQMKIGFKPKYVSNLNKGTFHHKKLPFVSTPLSPSNKPEKDEVMETVPGIDDKEQNEEDADSEISYVGKTVEPLKIKLTKIKPFKEKKHKHKKKKKKRDRSRERDEKESEVQSDLAVDMPEMPDKDELNVQDEVTDNKSDVTDSKSPSKGAVIDTKSGIKSGVTDSKGVSANDESKSKSDDIKSVESAGNETTSNDGDDDNSATGGKQNKKTKVKEKKHICEYCNVGFSQKCDLRRHTMIHTGERPWPCDICDKRFQRKTDLAKHMRTHTGEKPYACEFCDKRVSDKSQLNVHRRLHTGDRPYQCMKCGKRCITSSELSRHRAVHCSDKYQCKLCQKVFTIKECLGMHMKLHYRSRGRPFKCEKCAIGFDKKDALDIHHCVDPTLNVYVCSECYEKFTDEMLYADHIKTHDLGVLACNVCTLIFPDKHSLETHLCTLGEDKPRQIQCEICDMEFQDPGIVIYDMLLYPIKHCELFVIKKAVFAIGFLLSKMRLPSAFRNLHVGHDF